MKQDSTISYSCHAVKMAVSTKILFLFLTFIIANNAQAQFFPYNPYMNPGYRAGQQLGQAIAQRSKYGRNQLRKAINKWSECKNGTLSLEHGAVALYGSNGYFCSSTVDSRISSKLKSINKSNDNITDINILENGNFIIVYNDGKQWYGVIPSGLKTALDEYPYGTAFRSVSFNESGTYAITTSSGFKSNNAAYQAFYDDNVGEYGELLSVNISGDGAVFCYSDGTRFCGTIPEKVESAMHSFKYTANYVKFNKHGDYLICSKLGSYAYVINDVDAVGNASTVYYDYTKERRKKLKKKAFEKWDSKATYKYGDKRKTHRVWCPGQIIDGHYICLETIIESGYNSAPTVNVDINGTDDELFGGLPKNIPDDGIPNMTLKLVLSNGETITNNSMKILKNFFGMGIRLSFSLVSMRSDKRTLNGDISSIRYLVGLLSSVNIKSLTFKERYTVDLSSVETSSQLCYDFYRMSDESGNSRFLPE